MNIEDILRASVAPPPTNTAAHADGYLFVIRCMPDPFTGELLNVGVCARGPGGERLVKVIEEPGRLKCLYGESAHSIVNMAQIAKEAALKGLAAPSPQLVFDSPTPFYNSTLDQAVREAFSDQVTVALPHREPTQVAAVTDDEALTRVAKLLRSNLELEADQMLPDPFLMIPGIEGGKPRTVKIPLRPANGFGVIRSADYGADTLKTHLMDSALDLHFAGHYRTERLRKVKASVSSPSLAVFVYMNPGAGATRRKQAQKVLDDVADRSIGLIEFHPGLGEDDMVRQISHWRHLNNTDPTQLHH